MARRPTSSPGHVDEERVKTEGHSIDAVKQVVSGLFCFGRKILEGVERNCAFVCALLNAVDDLHLYPSKQAGKKMDEVLARYLSDPMQLLIKTYQIGSTEVSIELDSAVGTGGFVWDGAQIMAHFFKKHPSVFGSMTRVLELGSGTGFLSIAFAKMYPTVKVHATDIAGNLQLIEQNVALNQVNSSVKAEELDWRYPYRLKDFDMVFGSDLVYLPDLHIPLISTLKKVATAKTQVYLCNEWRKRSDLEFYLHAREAGLTPTILPLWCLDDSYRSEEVPIVRLIPTSK